MEISRTDSHVDPGASLRLEGVRKQLGFTLEASFTVRPGERAALLGRSGSGKTTLLRLITGLERPDAGRVFLGGDEITDWPVQRREIGVVFQDQALFPALNVLENLTFALRMRGVAARDREARALPWLDRMGLSSLQYVPVTRLSGGERQRVAFIRAILWNPRLLLLDEPFSALDPSMRDTARRELVELHRLWPVPMLLVTHDEGDLASVATVRLTIEEADEGRRRTVVRPGN